LSLFDHSESGRLSPIRGTLLWWSECPFFLTAILNSIVITLVVSQGCERVGERVRERKREKDSTPTDPVPFCIETFYYRLIRRTCE